MVTETQLFKQGDTVLEDGWYVNRGPRGGKVVFSPLILLKKGDVFPESTKDNYTWVRDPYERDEHKRKILQAYRGHVRSVTSDHYDFIIIAESYDKAQSQLEKDNAHWNYSSLWVDPEPIINDVGDGTAIMLGKR